MAAAITAILAPGKPLTSATWSGSVVTLTTTAPHGYGTGEPYDGITEVWWESLEAVQAGLGAPGSLEAQQRLIKDESKFIDFARSCVFMTEEHMIFGD